MKSFQRWLSYQQIQQSARSEGLAAHQLALMAEQDAPSPTGHAGRGCGSRSRCPMSVRTILVSALLAAAGALAAPASAPVAFSPLDFGQALACDKVRPGDASILTTKIPVTPAESDLVWVKSAFESVGFPAPLPESATSREAAMLVSALLHAGYIVSARMAHDEASRGLPLYGRSQFASSFGALLMFSMTRQPSYPRSVRAEGQQRDEAVHSNTHGAELEQASASLTELIRRTHSAKTAVGDREYAKPPVRYYILAQGFRDRIALRAATAQVCALGLSAEAASNLNASARDLAMPGTEGAQRVFLLQVATPQAAPPRGATDSETFNDLFLSPQLLRANLRAGIEGEVVVQLLQKMGIKVVRVKNINPGLEMKPLKPGTYSDGDLKKLLAEIDRISSEVTKPIDLERSDGRAFIKKAFDIEGAPQVKVFLQPGTEANQFASDTRDFLESAAVLPEYMTLLQYIAPDTLSSESEAKAIDYGPLAFEYAQPSRIFIHTVLHGRAATLLKNGEELRRQEHGLIDRSRKLFPRERSFPSLHQVDLWTYRATQTVVGDRWIPKLLTPATEAQLVAEVSLLRSRLQLLADPYVSGLCDRLNLDPASLKSSEGDWSRVRTSSGQRIEGTSWSVGSVALAYEYGCFVKKDFSVARRVLTKWANAHQDRAKMAMFTHCKLALWSRYGIGGYRDEAEAKRWEERAFQETTAACPTPSIVDPRNPWLDLR